ncbi:hypothetical protein [Neptunicoccus cionae]|uniref:Excalibur calcium-binding domain-containing protein n=1 Tax=Neptunicoccus cionae TaxID=2035344 RepID=A0A916VNV5_9RHOB|nr:hypothetical protein [Amylibacter cionae]GGA13319.1 hypothetical protein GCM10011498_11590 [Amylibacter cionae]
MRSFVVTVLAAGLVAGCTTQSPNDQDQYFDNITPDPIALQTERERLTAAENGGDAVQLPGSDGSTPSAPENRPSGISNTQDFQAVVEQESIASDAAKLAALRQSYTVVDPEPLPQRRTDVNLAAYAISQKQAVGARTYKRSSSSMSSCSRYRNDPDAAQRRFLEAGGPERDRSNLDPDGDGFACSWNPDLYRNLLPS